MADNLRFGDGSVPSFYLQHFGLQFIREISLKNGEWERKFPFNDPELVDHLNCLKDILSNKFEKFCMQKSKGRSYIPREKAAELVDEFYKLERKELTRIQEYQESRPDLYN